jgi:hypothetical protein
MDDRFKPESVIGMGQNMQKGVLVHCPSDVGQYACPIHNYPHDRLALIDKLQAYFEEIFKSTATSTLYVKMLISQYG